MSGRADERQNPFCSTATICRSVVWMSCAEPIRASGRRAAPAGRTHDRTRTDNKFRICRSIPTDRPHMNRLGSQLVCRSAGSSPIPCRASATSSGICAGLAKVMCSASMPPMSFDRGTGRAGLPAQPRILPRPCGHQTGGACRRAREPRGHGCMTGATSNWPIPRPRNSTRTTTVSGPAAC